MTARPAPIGDRRFTAWRDAMPPRLAELHVSRLVRRYPSEGKQLEAALREALDAGWRAGRTLSTLTEANDAR